MEPKEKEKLLIGFLDNLKETAKAVKLDKNGISMIAGMMIDVGKTLRDGDDEEFKNIAGSSSVLDRILEKAKDLDKEQLDILIMLVEQLHKKNN